MCFCASSACFPLRNEVYSEKVVFSSLFQGVFR
jgi:hypothetical protein